jgi:hypothetical protein
MKWGLIVSSVVAVALMSGCAKAPEQDVVAAKAALEKAQTVEAERYASAEFNAAKDSLNAALVEIEKQNSAFPLVRNYSRAKALLASAASISASTEQKAAAEKEKVKVEVDTLIAQLAASVAQADSLLTKAPKGKEGKEALEAIANDIAQVKTANEEATASVTAGDYMGARDKASAAMEKITAIKDELNNAIAKTTKK